MPEQERRWQNRIVGTGEEAPDQLMANPKNWRIHPLTQQDAVEAALDQVGWVQSVIVNRTTGHLVDGHLRVQLAISREETTIPVNYVELSEHDEALVLATLDPLAGLAATDADKLGQLLEEATADGDGLAALMADLAKTAKPVEDLVTEGQVANDKDFWPVIRLQVAPEVYRDFNQAWEQIEGEDDSEKLAEVLARATTPRE